MEVVKVNESEKVNGITIENWKRFHELMCAMSPENVCCDGEISRAAANRRYKALLKQWRTLEREVGKKVGEFEVIKVAMRINL